MTGKAGRGVLLKDLQPADWVMALDAYRDDTGREPAVNLKGVALGYVRPLPKNHESMMRSAMPWEWVFTQAKMTSEQIVAAYRGKKLQPAPDCWREWGELRALLDSGAERPLLLLQGEDIYRVMGAAAPQARMVVLWPVRAFELAFLRHALARMVSQPGKYLVDLGPPDKVVRFPTWEEWRTSPELAEEGA